MIEIFAKDISDEGLLSKIYKEPFKLKKIRKQLDLNMSEKP